MSKQELQHLCCDRCGFKQEFAFHYQVKPEEAKKAGWKSVAKPSDNSWYANGDLCPNCVGQYVEWWKHPTPRLRVAT